MTAILITPKNALKAYKAADNKRKKLLENLLGTDFLNLKITDRVKSYEDACEIEGIDPKSILPYDESKKLTIDQESLNAIAKLTLIVKVINEGWVPDWTNSNQYKYYAWFKFSSASGWVCHDYANWLSPSSVGSRLAMESAEKAEYVGKQFTELYNKFFSI